MWLDRITDMWITVLRWKAAVASLGHRKELDVQDTAASDLRYSKAVCGAAVLLVCVSIEILQGYKNYGVSCGSAIK